MWCFVCCHILLTSKYFVWSINYKGENELRILLQWTYCLSSRRTDFPFKIDNTYFTPMNVFICGIMFKINARCYDGETPENIILLFSENVYMSTACNILKHIWKYYHSYFRLNHGETLPRSIDILIHICWWRYVFVHTKCCLFAIRHGYSGVEFEIFSL